MQKKQIREAIDGLIVKNGKIDIEVQKEIIGFLFDSFVQYDKVLLFVDGGEIQKVLTKTAFKTICELLLVPKYKDIELLTYNEEKGTHKWNIRLDGIFDAITTLNSCTMIRYTSNLFAEKQTIELDTTTRVVTVTTNKLHIKPISKKGINEKEYREIVTDYKSHFAYFDSLLKLIIDMRFAKDKKASFLHLRVKSDWGKSFMSGLLKNLDIAIEVDYHNLMNKSTNDIHPLQVRNSFVMVLDEFNNFSQEMKKLSHSITLAPKYGMAETVDLFLKILMSAEKSPSFTGGVDEQIVNRVMVFDIPDHEAKPLVKRAVYKKFGNAKYMRALEYYSYLSFKQQIDKYLAMEELEAYRFADMEVRKTYLSNKMQGMENINQTIVSIVTPVLEDIAFFDIEDNHPAYKAIKRNVIRIDSGKYEGHLFIKQPHKTFETILKNEVIETEFKKMKFKLSGINEFFNLVTDHTRHPFKLFGKTHKGILINTQPKDEIPIEIEQPDGTIKNIMIDKTNGINDIDSF